MNMMIGGSGKMTGQSKPVRASGTSSRGRTDGSERARPLHPLAPFWAMAGASLPWLVCDAFIKSPGKFWTFRGVIVLAATALGVILVGLAWHDSRGLSDYEK
jgi:hypothetical protein